MHIKTITAQTIEEILETDFLPTGELAYPPENIAKDKQYSLDTYTGEVFYKESSGISYLDYFIARAFEYLSASAYLAIKGKEKEQLLQYISTAKSLSDILIRTMSKTLCNCQTYQKQISGISADQTKRRMVTLIPLVSSFAIVRDWTTLKEITGYFINSLNAKTCIIGRGERTAYIEWFTLKLLSQVFEIEIDTRKPFHPNKDKFKHYQQILDNWNTDNMAEVDKMIYMLADLHIDDAQENWDEFDCILSEELYLLFAYEIIVLLQIRKYKNLENPYTFSHSIMQTSMMKSLLKIEESLPSPQPQTDIYIFLEKLKEKCPDVEIPEWLSGKVF